MLASVTYSLIFGLASSLILFCTSNIIALRILSDARAAAALRVLSFSLIPTALSATLSGYFVGVKRVGYNAAATVISQAIRLGLTVSLLSFSPLLQVGSSVVRICVAITLTEWLGCLLIILEYFFDRRCAAKGGRTSEVSLSRVAKSSLPLAFSAYVRALLLNAEHILIPKKLRESGESSEQAYAHYGTLHGMALPLLIYPMSPLSSFSGLLVPEFAEDLSAGRRERMSRVASKALNATLSYSLICSVFLFCFSSELGYTVYTSFDAGYYLSVLAFAVPIMYLDHVTDSMLKGMGEQVYSMWINISDSLLSVILVCLLIPKMGIMGYALVIILMEGYNFLLSFVRLKRKISFKITPLSSIILPLISSFIGVRLADKILYFNGSTTTLFWLVMKMVFALSVTVFIMLLPLVLQNFTDKIKMKNKDLEPI